MKILIVGMTEFHGGMEAYIMNMYRYLNREKYKCVFVNECTGKLAYADEIENLGGKIINITMRKNGIIRHYKEIQKLFCSSNFDIVYYNTLSLANIDYLLFAKKNSKKIIHAHSPETARGIRGFLREIHKIIISNITDIFLACSENAGKSMFGNKQKFDVIHNAIEISRFKYDKDKREELREKFNLNECIVLGTVGRIAKVKNPLFTIDIFEEFHKKYPNAVFLHIGDGNLRKELEQKIIDKGLKDKYLILGEKDDSSPYYQIFDAFIFPSIYEGLGIVCLEAQASGTHCIVSTEVPQEADTKCGLFHQVSLNNTAKEWAEVVEKYCFLEKSNTSEYIKKAGYDVRENIKVIESFFEAEA